LPQLYRQNQADALRHRPGNQQGGAVDANTLLRSGICHWRNSA
jgi:hypothetical protein